jgi:hypothetical protein
MIYKNMLIIISSYPKQHTSQSQPTDCAQPKQCSGYKQVISKCRTTENTTTNRQNNRY